MVVHISKKKFVADGIFKAKLNEFLTRELAEDDYSDVENVLVEKGTHAHCITVLCEWCARTSSVKIFNKIFFKTKQTNKKTNSLCLP
uniref:Uncharacterized protein n=1 Tax=Sarcophilus harrisii TaxID=9305 RepID=A0A7N4Q029_SARHA